MFDLGRTFLAAVERSPEAVAVIDGARRPTYGEWYIEISRVAAGLSGLGLRRGDRVAVVLQNHLEMATLHWACQFAGIVVAPLNWRIKPDELDYCLADSAARAVVFDNVAAAAVGEPRRRGACRGSRSATWTAAPAGSRTGVAMKPR